MKIKHQFGSIVDKQEWNNYGLMFCDKSRRNREMHAAVVGGEVKIRRIVAMGRNLAIVDAIGGIYLFRDGELVDKASLGISDIQCSSISVNGRWLGVGSREDRNIVLF